MAGCKKQGKLKCNFKKPPKNIVMHFSSKLEFKCGAKTVVGFRYILMLNCFCSASIHVPQDKGPVEFRVMQNRQEVMQEGKRTKSKNGQIEPLPIHQGWKSHQDQKGAKISCQDAARVQKNVCGPIGRITLQVNLPNAELLKVDIRVGNKCHKKRWI